MQPLSDSVPGARPSARVRTGANAILTAQHLSGRELCVLPALQAGRSVNSLTGYVTHRGGVHFYTRAGPMPFELGRTPRSAHTKPFSCVQRMSIRVLAKPSFCMIFCLCDFT